MDSPSPLKWGILGCGKISSDFVNAVQTLSPELHLVVGAGARTLSSAQDFANKFNIPKAFGSYDELLKDPEIQVVYIGTINPDHIKSAKLALEHGKHVLCEKPIGINVRETKELIAMAKEKNLFLMEGIWSRFFPVYKRLKEELDKGTVGEVVQLIVPFCTLLTHKERCSLKELGGGTVLDVGVYCVQFTSFVFGGDKPIKIVASGHLNEDGIDESTSATVIYSKGRTATLITHGRAKYETDAVILGTKGSIKVPFRFWCPTELVTPNGIETFDLPKTDRKFNYANSVGLSYEAEEVRKCLKQGLLESPLMTLDETVTISEIMESIRKQTGVEYPQDLL